MLELVCKCGTHFLCPGVYLKVDNYCSECREVIGGYLSTTAPLVLQDPPDYCKN